jgi:hypothetical protein
MLLWRQRGSSRRASSCPPLRSSKRERKDNRRQQAELIMRAADVHKLIIEVGHDVSSEKWAEVMRLTTLTPIEWGTSDAPDALMVGMWVEQKRMLALQDALKHPRDYKLMADLWEYFDAVQHMLGLWMRGSIGRSWFWEDLQRLWASPPTLAEEATRHQEFRQERAAALKKTY